MQERSIKARERRLTMKLSNPDQFKETKRRYRNNYRKGLLSSSLGSSKAPSSNQRWTEEEVMFIKQRLDMTMDDIALHLGRTYESVVARAYKENISFDANGKRRRGIFGKGKKRNYQQYRLF